MTRKRSARHGTPLAAAVACALGAAAPHASAEEFRWAATTDPQTMDPHAVSSAPVLGFLNNVYEGLVRRGRDMSVEPALAESWERLGEDGWRFDLRRDVTYHDGQEFTADDVLFSYERASSEESDVRSWFAPVSEVVVVDDHTIDFMTNAPNPLFPDSIANFMIMDRDWTSEAGAERPSTEAENAATRSVNGTGAYRLASRDPGVRTVLEAFDGWWGADDDDGPGNVTSATFTPIGESSTAVAALLSGEIDYVSPVPLQDLPRLKSNDDLTVYEDVESRIIMFGFGLDHETLTGGDDAGDPNPFRDVRVREAAYRAIDADALVSRIMRGSAETASQLVSEGTRGYSEANAERLEHDPEAAKALLAEAGFPDGFSFALRCPNDRYINDEAICQAAASMMTRVGLRAELDTMPVRNYWPELREGNFDMYLLGWSPGTFDAEHPIRFLLATPNEEKKLGSWNFGGVTDARVDELLPMIQTELDDAKRQGMIDEVVKTAQDEIAYVPLYVQPLVAASASNVEVVQRPDDFLIVRWIEVGE